MDALAIELAILDLPSLVGQFLSQQLNHVPGQHPPLSFHGPVKVFHSAFATFRAPSDPSGIGGMRREPIRATPTWYHGPARYDCVFVNTDDATDGMLSMDIARVYAFFSIVYINGQTHECALIQWYDRLTDEPDGLTGMWMVSPSLLEDGSRYLAVIPVDSIIRCAHLLPIFRAEFVHDRVDPHNALDLYRGFYVNCYADHHAFALTHSR